MLTDKKEQAQEELHEALIDLRDAERSVERAKQRVRVARAKLHQYLEPASELSRDWFGETREVK